MHIFHLFENDVSESDFRALYEEIEERVASCCSQRASDECCPTECHYLIAFDIDATKNGYPSVFGIDCDVEVLCWGGHSDETSVEVFCATCAKEEHRFRTVERRRQAQELEKRREVERAALARKEQIDRTLRDHWNNLLALQFEGECVELFRSMADEVRSTARTHDGNIDIIIKRGGVHGAAQCKAWNHPCGVKTVREFIGTIFSEGLNFGYLISKSGFTANARLLLQKTKIIEGWDLNDLVTHAARILEQREKRVD